MLQVIYKYKQSQHEIINYLNRLSHSKYCSHSTFFSAIPKRTFQGGTVPPPKHVQIR